MLFVIYESCYMHGKMNPLCHFGLYYISKLTAICPFKFCECKPTVALFLQLHSSPFCFLKGRHKSNFPEACDFLILILRFEIQISLKENTIGKFVFYFLLMSALKQTSLLSTKTKIV